MSHFACIVSSQDEKRVKFHNFIRSNFISFSCSVQECVNQNNLCLFWERSAHANLQVGITPFVGLHFIAGRIMDDVGPDSDPLKKIAVSSLMSGHNGFYAACRYDAVSRAVTVGTDTLGLFPVYYWADVDTIIFSSSLMVFMKNPLFDEEMDPLGLAASLLIMHGVGGRTTIKDVQRLAPGTELRWMPGMVAKEVSCTPLIPGDRYFGASREECRDVWNVTLDRVAARVSQCGDLDISMSGGLDSRLMGGYLKDHNVKVNSALTLGSPRDHEKRCALAAVRSLGWKAVSVPVDLSLFYRDLLRQVSLETVATSVLDMSWWQLAEVLKGHSGQIISGFLGNAVMGGSGTLDDVGRDGKRSFDALFSIINAWGFSPRVVADLLKPLGGESLVAEVIEDLRDCYRNLPGKPFQRSWLFYLTHRQRMHVAPCLWRLSFGASPVPFYFDRDMLEVAASMPLQHFKNRIAQIDLLVHRFPSLARLPLDTNSWKTLPLTHSAYQRALNNIRKTLGFHRILRKLLPENSDKRYYYRVMNINNSGWMNVRRNIEKNAEEKNSWIDTDSLKNEYPWSVRRIKLKEPITEGSGLKVLMAIMAMQQMRN